MRPRPRPRRRERLATKVQKKIFSDATRFRYGDAHMEEPLKALKFAPGRGPPELKQFTESVTPEVVLDGHDLLRAVHAVHRWKGKKYATSPRGGGVSAEGGRLTLITTRIARTPIRWRDSPMAPSSLSPSRPLLP